MKWRRIELKTSDFPEGGGSSTKVYEDKGVEIYRGYRQTNGVSPEFKVCKIKANGLELEGGPKLHDKIATLLAERTKSAFDDKETIFRHAKDEKAAKEIRSFILKTILREFARKPSVFFAWLGQDRMTQRRVGANKLRLKFNKLLGESFV